MQYATLGVFLLLWAQALAAAAEESAALDVGLPVNDPTALQSCQYGDIPGTWAHSPNLSLTYAAELRPFGHPQLPFTAEIAHVGARYQTLEPSCQLEILIGPFLDGSVAKEMPAPGQPGRQPIRILIFSDSTDTHALQYLIEHHYRRLNGDNTSEEYVKIFSDSRIQLHDRGPSLNHVVTRMGLDLFHMFILGLHALQDGDMHMRVNNARTKFDELVGPDADGRQIQPDIISVHNVHWTLLNMATANDAKAEPELADGFMLPQAFLNRFMNQLARLAHLVRGAFPYSLLTMHTAAMVRHDPSTGKTEGRRAWIDRMFVAQLNEAHRLVARRLMMPMVDWEHMTRGLVPKLYLFDDIHPTDWVSFEFYNVLLNLHADSQRRRRRRGLSSRASGWDVRSALDELHGLVSALVPHPVNKRIKYDPGEVTVI